MKYLRHWDVYWQEWGQPEGWAVQRACWVGLDRRDGGKLEAPAYWFAEKRPPEALREEGLLRLQQMILEKELQDARAESGAETVEHALPGRHQPGGESGDDPRIQ